MAPTQLEIKVNALKRLQKEEKLYKKELEDQSSLVEQMKAQNADPYELKKQIEVLNESEKMVGELAKKVKTHTAALKEFIDKYSGDESLAEAQELLK